MSMNNVRRIAILGLLAALLIVAQVSLAFLPNIELVSLLILLFSILTGKYAFAPVYVFVLAEGLIYGFTLWWFFYLYAWLPLLLLGWLFRHQRSPLFFAVINAGFGLCFGALYALLFLFTGGPASALSVLISGLPFDLLHCLSNFIVTLLLFRPLRQIGEKVLGGVFSSPPNPA